MGRFSDPHFKPSDWLMILWSVVLFLFAVWYWFTPSEKYLDVEAVYYQEAFNPQTGLTEWRGYVIRDTPRGKIYATWSTEMTPLSGPKCEASSRGELVPYDSRPLHPDHEKALKDDEKKERRVGIFVAHPDLIRCLESPDPAAVNETWTVHLGGFLRLFPETYDFVMHDGQKRVARVDRRPTWN